MKGTNSKFIFIIASLLLFVFLISSVSATICYQETANVSTACGGLATGVYSFEANNFYINYTKPTNALNTSLWQVKHGGVSVALNFSNFTLPSSCWNAYSDKIVLNAYLNTQTPWFSIARCYNSTNWINISVVQSGTSGSGGPGTANTINLYDGDWSTGSVYDGEWVGNLGDNGEPFYEEAMYWDLDTTSPNITLISPANATITLTNSINFTANISDNLMGITNYTLNIYNSTGLYNQTTILTPSNPLQATVGIVVNLISGSYNWFYNIFDFAGNSFTTSNNTLTIDTVYPQINFTSPTLATATTIARNYIEANVSVTDTNQNTTAIRLYNGSRTLIDTFDCSGLSCEYPKDSSQVLMMHFDNQSYYGENATRVYDFSGNGNNGSCASTATCPAWNSSGKLGGAMSFDSVNDVINFGNNQSLQITANITISFWLKGTDGDIISKYGSIGNNESFTIYLADNPRRAIWYISPNGTSVGAVVRGGILNPNNWNHVVAVYNGTGAFIYTNGVRGAVTTYSAGLFNSNANLQIGAGARSAAFNGSIDEVAIYNRSLSATEILNLYNGSVVKYKNWSGLAQGVYYINATTTDLAGNINNTETRQITLDTANPNATLNTPANNSYSSNLTQNLTANLTDNLGIKNATLYVYNSTGLYSNTTITNSAGILSQTVGVVVSFIAGSYNWFYDLFDFAGNEAQSDQWKFTISAHVPNISFITPPTPIDAIEQNRSYFTVQVTVADGNLLSNGTINLYNSTRGLVNSTIIDYSGTYNNTGTVTFLQLSDGKYYYNSTVQNVLDAINTTETRTILIDTVAPNVTLLSPNGTLINRSYSLCYQESANTTNQVGTDGNCGLSYNGVYSFDNNWHTATYNITNTYDGFWNTYGRADSGKLAYMYINYTKPLGANSNSIWEVHGGVAPDRNLTLPSNCLNQNLLQFQITSNYTANNATWSCYNGTNWILLLNISHTAIYEEAMIWNISTSTIAWPTLNYSAVNFTVNLSSMNTGGIQTSNLSNATLYVYNNRTGALVNQTFTSFLSGMVQATLGTIVNLVDGVYHWFYISIDAATNQAQSEQWLVEIDATAPNSTFITPPTDTDSLVKNNSWIYASIDIGDINGINSTRFDLFNSTRALVNSSEYSYQYSYVDYSINSTVCYQEFANVSTSCGGLDTGTYTNDSIWTTLGNVYDGNITTYGSSAGNYQANITINYSKPVNSSSSSTWMVEAGSSGRSLPLNITYSIPEICFNQSILSFKLGSWSNMLGQGGVRMYCYNGTNYILFNSSGTMSGHKYIYEEAMNWNISIPTTITVAAISNITSFNFTGLSDGRYYFNATVTGKYGLTNYTETRTVLIDTQAPNVTLTSPFMGSAALGWWNASWSKEKEITGITSYFVRLNVTYESSMNVNFSDLRFVDSSRTKELAYWIERSEASNYATVTVKTDYNRSIFMYYGNSNVNTTSNANAVYFNAIRSYWSFDNTTSMVGNQNSSVGTNSFVDSSGGNIVISSDGKFGNAISANNAVTSGQNLPISESFWKGGNNTISMWFNQIGACGGVGYNVNLLWGSGVGGTYTDNVDAHFRCDNSRNHAIQMLAGPSPWTVNDGYTGISNVTWYMLTLVTSQYQIDMYLDGANVKNITTGGWNGLNYDTMQNYFFDGSNNDVNMRPSRNLLLDEVSNFNRTLTATEIVQLANFSDVATIGSEKTYNITIPVLNYTTVNFTANISINTSLYNIEQTNLSNATIYIYNNNTGALVNRTTTSFLSNIFNSVVGTVITLVDGTYHWFYQAMDAAGNAGQSDQWKFTISAHVPNISFITPPTPIDAIEQNRSYFTVQVTVADGNLLSNGTINLYNSTRGLVNSTIIDYSGTYNNTGTVTFLQLSDGKYYYNSTVQNVLDAINTTETRTILIDTVAPNVTLLSPNGTLINRSYSLCYQESANTTNQVGTDGNCGLSYNGVYSFDNNWHTATYNITNTYDGFWNTYGRADSGKLAYMYINYTKPLGANSNSIWEVHGGVAPDRNLTLPSNCLNQNLLQFQITSNYTANNATWSCYNGTNWILLLNISHTAIYEEAMIWNISTSTIAWPTLNYSAVNFTVNLSSMNTGGIQTSNLSNATLYVYNNRTGALVNQTFTSFLSGMVQATLGTIVNLVDGVYHWFYISIDAATNQAQSEQWLVEIDATAPNSTFITPPTTVSGTEQNFTFIYARVNTSDPNGINYTRIDLFNSTRNLINTSQTNYSSTSLCYQETANVSTSCGGLNTGKYDYPGTPGRLNIYMDGNWSSNVSMNTNINFTINYTKPQGTLGGIWQVKDAEGLWNLTLPTLCLNTVSLKVYNDGSNYFHYSCYNGSNYNEIFVTPTGFVDNIFSEEAMIWNITGAISYNNETSSVNFTSLPDGRYYFNATSMDNFGLANASETRTVLIDTIAPNTVALSPANYNISGVNIVNLSVNLTAGLGNGLTANLSNVTLYIYNETNNVLTFDGRNDYVVTPNFTTNNSFTISFWSNWRSNSVGVLLDLGYTEGTGTTGLMIRHGSADPKQLLWCAKNGTGIPGCQAQIASTEYNETYQLFTIVYNATTSTLTGYINGVVTLATTSVGAFPTPLATSYAIGAALGGGQALNGSIDELRIYNRMLTTTEISQLYRNNLRSNKALVSTGLITYYDMEPIASNLTALNNLNKTTYINNGTLINGPLFNRTGLVNKTFTNFSADTYKVEFGTLAYLLEGTYNWYYEAYDAVGNMNTSQQRMLAINLYNPNLTVISPPTTTNGYIGNIANIYVRVNVSDNLGINTSVFMLFNSTYGLVSSSTTTHTLTYALVYNALESANFTGLQDGRYYYNVTTMDQYGNKNVSELRTALIDNKAPVVTLLAPEDYNVNTSTSVNFLAYLNGSNPTSLCYQESANTTNQNGNDGDCNLNYAGTYWGNNGILEPENVVGNIIGHINDANFSTYYGGATNTAFNITYIIPPNLSPNGSLWSIRAFNSSLRYMNISIPSSCIITNNLTIFSKTSSASPNFYAYYYCVNASSNVLLLNSTYTNNYATWFSEEAMIWNIAGYIIEQSNLSNATLYVYNNATGALVNRTTTSFVAGIFQTTIGTIVNLVDGAYHWFYTAMDVAGNLAQTPQRNINISEPTSLTFVSQTPRDINFTNIFGVNSTIINYTIDEYDLVNNSIKLFYTNNKTTSTISYYINGTSVSGLREINNTFLAGTSPNYSAIFKLYDYQYLPGTYNINESIMESTAHSNGLLGVNNLVAIELNNVSNTTMFNFLDMMINKTNPNANASRVYYCNSSYVSGNVRTSSSCTNFYTITSKLYDYNSSITSRHVIIPVAIVNGMVGNVIVTPTSKFVFQGSEGGWRYYYIANPSHVNATTTSTNLGVSWTSQTYTVDAHLHQSDGTDTLYYYACANNSGGIQGCSVLRSDLINLTRMNPNVFVTTPGEGVYGGTFNSTMNISYAATSVNNGLNITNYTIYLAYTNGTRVSTLVPTTANSSFIYNISSLTSGQYMIIINATDNMSRKGMGYSYNFTIDNLATNVTLLTPIDNTYLNYSSGINLTANLSDNGAAGLSNATLYVYDSGAVLVNQTTTNLGTSVYQATIGTVITLVDGVYTWLYNLIDILGNQFSSSANDLIIDTTAPIVYFGTFTAPSGMYNASTAVHVDAIVIEPNFQNITYTIGNSTWVNSTTYTYILIDYIDFTELSDDIYSYNISVCDLVGHCTSTSTRTMTLDNIAPTIEYIAYTDADSSFINGNQVKINLSIVDTNWFNTTVRVYDSLGSIVGGDTWVNSGSNNFQSTSGALIDGPYSFNATTCDIAGNCNYSAIRNIIVETTPPTINITTPLNGSIFNVSQIEMNYTFVEANIYKCWYILGGVTYDPLECGQNLTFNDTGIYDLTVFIEDMANNTANSSIYFLIDLEQPNASIINPVPSSFINYSGNINFTVNISDLGPSGISNATIKVYNSTDDLINQTTIIPGAGVSSGTIGVIINVIDSFYTWFYEIMDFANNYFVTDLADVTIDNIAPVINFSIETEANNSFLNRSNVVINVSISDTNLINLTITLYDIINTPVYEMKSEYTATGVNYLNITGLADGNYTFNASVCDAAGNCARTDVRQIVLDTAAPFVNISYPENRTNINPYYGNSLPHIINYSFTDITSVTRCWWGLNNESTPYSGFGPGTNGISCQKPGEILTVAIDPASILDKQYNTWYIFVQDTVGHIGIGATRFFVNSSWGPTVISIEPSASGSGSGGGGGSSSIAEFQTVPFQANASALMNLSNVTLYVYNTTNFSETPYYRNTTTYAPATAPPLFTGTSNALVDMVVWFVRGTYYWWFDTFDTYSDYGNTTINNITVNMAELQIISPVNNSRNFSNNGWIFAVINASQPMDSCKYSINGLPNQSVAPLNFLFSPVIGVNNLVVYCRNGNGTGWTSSDFEYYPTPSLGLSITSPRNDQYYRDAIQVLGVNYNHSFTIPYLNMSLNGNPYQVFTNGQKVQFPEGNNVLRVRATALPPYAFPYDAYNAEGIEETVEIRFTIGDKTTGAFTDMMIYFYAFLLFGVLAMFFAYLKASEDAWQFFMRTVWYLMELMIGFGVIIESIRVIRTLTGTGGG
jgi:hypothetical protein